MSVFDKLTDTSRYTGTHRNRFDSSGRGLGLAGRDGGAFAGDTGPTGAGANLALRPTLTTSSRPGSAAAGSGGRRMSGASVSPSTTPPPPNPLYRTPSPTRPLYRSDAPAQGGCGGGGGGAQVAAPGGGGGVRSTSPSAVWTRPPTSSGSRRGSIFDRLTDPNLYTGAHRERFDADGRGRGLAGREAGGEYNMNGILRPNLGRS